MKILIEMQQMGYTIEYMEVNTDLEKLHRRQHRKKMDMNYQGIKRQRSQRRKMQHMSN